MKNNKIHVGSILIAIILTFIITLSAAFIWQNLNVQTDETDDWLTYISDEGFSFKYPEGYEVNENVDPENPEITNVFIIEAENKPPIMQINVSDNSVSFSLWEGMPWKGFPEIVGTFKTQ